MISRHASNTKDFVFLLAVLGIECLWFIYYSFRALNDMRWSKNIRKLDADYEIMAVKETSILQPASVQRVIAALGSQNFQFVGISNNNMPGKYNVLLWLVIHSEEPIFAEIRPIKNRAIVAFYSEFLDDAVLDTTLPSTICIKEPKFYLQTSQILELGLEKHRLGIKQLQKDHGIPQRINTLEEALDFENRYKQRYNAIVAEYISNERREYIFGLLGLFLFTVIGLRSLLRIKVILDVPNIGVEAALIAITQFFMLIGFNRWRARCRTKGHLG
jgi:hypothetical protein